jgi:hypothetical protein
MNTKKNERKETHSVNKQDILAINLEDWSTTFDDSLWTTKHKGMPWIVHNVHAIFILLYILFCGLRSIQTATYSLEDVCPLVFIATYGQYLLAQYKIQNNWYNLIRALAWPGSLENNSMQGTGTTDKQSCAIWTVCYLFSFAMSKLQYCNMKNEEKSLLVTRQTAACQGFQNMTATNSARIHNSRNLSFCLLQSFVPLR